jgi:hypothetical protein
VDVTFKIINDPDSSVTGHSWANDSFTKLYSQLAHSRQM